MNWTHRTWSQFKFISKNGMKKFLSVAWKWHLSFSMLIFLSSYCSCIPSLEFFHSKAFLWFSHSAYSGFIHLPSTECPVSSLCPFTWHSLIQLNKWKQYHVLRIPFLLSVLKTCGFACPFVNYSFLFSDFYTLYPLACGHASRLDTQKRV